MTQKTTLTAFEEIKTFSRTAYANKGSFEFLISEEMHKMEIKKLQDGIREEQFFVIIDLIDLKIIEMGGIEELGFDKHNFTLKNYIEMIPSNGITKLLTTLGKQTFLLSKSNLLGFLKPTYIVQIPMKVKRDDDKIYLVKRAISPWQITRCGRITAYLSHFTVIKDYNYEELNPRIVGIPDEYYTIVMQAFNLDFKQLRSNENLFSPQELTVLELYLDNTNTSNDIATALNIKLLTLNSYNKSIIQKAKKMFSEDLPIKTARDVAIYLQKNGLFRK
jgi:hypothetical protein